jgi:glycerophosphoryl diester phosphodiesterase
MATKSGQGSSRVNSTEFLCNNVFIMKKNFISLIFLILMGFNINAQVKIIAHRGASYMAPENTVASAKLAWKYKADAVECDIWLSKDTMIICSHDANTKRTTGQDLIISETSSVVLRTLNAGSFMDEKYRGQKLPFLSELIKTVPAGKELVIEIKCGSEVLPFLKREVSMDKKNRIFTLICFDLQTIVEAKKVFPGNSCYWLCSKSDQLEANLSKVSEAGLKGVSLHYSIIDEKVMKLAKELGLEVYAWTIDDPDEVKRLIALGVKGITTNRPGWILEQVEGLR